MTRVSAESPAPLPVQPPRSKPVRDDFSAMLDNGAPPPTSPARAGANDKTDRTPPADRRSEAAKSDIDGPADEQDVPGATGSTAPAPEATDAVSGKKAAPDVKAAEETKDAASTTETVATSAPDPATPATATPDAPAVAIPVIPVQVTHQPVQPPIAMSSPAKADASGPLSIAAAALAATAATANAAKPAVLAADATPDAAAGEATSAAPTLATTAGPTTTTTPTQAVKPTPPAPNAATTADAQASSSATSVPTATQPAAKPNAPSEAKTVTAQATAPADGATAETKPTAASHDHRAAAPQTVVTDSSGQILTVAPPAAPTTASITAPQYSVVATPAAPVPLDGLAMQIAATAVSGKTSFEIRLDPAELGRIDVRLDVDRHGNVTSHLTVEKPETLAMLRQDAPQLQRALNDAGLQSSDKGMQFSLGDQSSSGRNASQNGNSDSGRAMQRLVIVDDANPSIASMGRSYGRMLASSSGIDIRV